MMSAGRPCHERHHQILGAGFRFRSDSSALLDVVDAAYAGHAAPGLRRDAGPLLEVELRLLPGLERAPGDPPRLRTHLDGRVLRGVMDSRNHVLVAPGRRCARIVVSADMLDRPYHLRYEFIEFAVFLLAARCQGLVPMHGACVGRDGRGLLVLGESGTGKSTLVLHGLLEGLALLSEDAVFVEPGAMLATGVANFLHVRTDALGGLGDTATRRWIAGSPVIRRRSGVEKFEADLRRVPGGMRAAPASLALAGTVILTSQSSGRREATLLPVAADDAMTWLANGQPYAASQPGWRRFERGIARAPVHRLQRGHHPRSSVDALQRLLG